MCKATASSRATCHVIEPADADAGGFHAENPTLTHRALSDEEHIPHTVSAGSGCSGGHFSYNVEEPQHNRLCQVTGFLSSVLDDYVVYPKVIGEGRYGCVRECVHRETGRSYACKSIDKCKIDRLDHLRREVDLLPRMDHRGIMRVAGCYEDAYYVHIVTERYGGELFDGITANTTGDGCYPEEKAAAIVKSLLESVAYLHENDIVHRDIKPENILFESEAEDGPVRLIDFGLSRRHVRDEPPMSNPVGTAYYMSPELIEGRYDRSCDVWSVGTIAYILLSGYPPFNGRTDPDIFESIQRGRVEFPAQQWFDKSHHAKDLIRCLLRRDPEERLTAREALMHPWIKNCGKRQEKTLDKRKYQSLKYLRTP